MNLYYVEFLILDELLIQTQSIQFKHNQIKYNNNSQIK
jgi:hypothetical protein